MAAKAKKVAKGRPVLVTTAHRGVFFGYIEKDEGDTVTLTRARNCIYWPRSVGGFLGLAVTGPLADSRIGARTDRITLRAVTSVSDCSEVAIKAWEDWPTWK